eukprot:TRINITY_DN4766_c0_g1_i3.p2 TRINITY_DN4766_c0_g1~~TRINITY_DN4766_c0_g1_i3.p2  ORF type:complete len:103 (+),score=17.56 TRINITY_DN4766_c0_g1_i3:2155-2463(+)
MRDSQCTRRLMVTASNPSLRERMPVLTLVAFDTYIPVYAAMLGGKMSPDLEDLLLLNVIPFSLGLETAGGLTHVMLNRNTKVDGQNRQQQGTNMYAQIDLDH